MPMKFSGQSTISNSSGSDAAAVFGAHHDFRLAHHQLVAFAAHRLDQDRELQFAAAQNAKRVGGSGVFHAQGHVGQQFFFEARAQVARSYVLPFAAGEGRRIDGEHHRERRFVNHERLERRGIREVGDALADLNSLDARDRDDVSGADLFGFVAFEAAKRKKLRNLGGLNRSVELRDSHFGAALESSLKNARDGEAPQKIAVVEIGDLNLQHGLGIARRRRNRSDDLLEERLEIRRVVADLQVRDSGFRVGVDHGKIELIFGGVEVNEEIVDLIEHCGRTRVGPVDLVQHHDRLELRGQRFLQDVARLRQRAFARVHQHEHAIHHAQRALHFAAEVAVAGRVHDVDLGVVVGNRRIFRENRDAALALQIVRVHHARDQFLVLAENPALAQHGVHERRLPMVHVGDDGDIANRRRHEF